MNIWMLLVVVYLVLAVAATIGWAVMRGIQKRRLRRRYAERHMTHHWREKRCL